MIALPDLASLGLFVAAALVLLITPGPAVLYIVARSIDQGRRAGLVSTLGVHAGTLVHKYLGAAYLVFLGVRRLLDRTTSVTSRRPERRHLHRAFLDGVVVNVLNPKTALFFLAFLPQFVMTARGDVGAQILGLGLLFVGLGVITDGLYAVGAGTAAHWLRGNPQFARRERWVSGSMYIGLGVAAAFSSTHRK